MKTCIPLSTFDAVAFTARTSPMMPKYIFFRVLVTMNAMSLCGFLGHNPFSSQYVNFLSNGLKVKRVNTAFVPAEMVQNETLGDRAFQEYVGESVSASSFAVVGSIKSVTENISGSRPSPARLGLFYFDPKTFVIHGGAGNITRLAGQT